MFQHWLQNAETKEILWDHISKYFGRTKKWKKVLISTSQFQNANEDESLDLKILFITNKVNY